MASRRSSKGGTPAGIKVTLVEPGGFRTDWAGSSMRVDELTPAYQATVGALQQHRKSGALRGDPAKAAQAILQLANMPEPPRRLLLGTDAVFVAGALTAARAPRTPGGRG